MNNQLDRTDNYCKLINVYKRYAYIYYCDRKSNKIGKKKAELLAENTLSSRDLLNDPLLKTPIDFIFSCPKSIY